MATTPDGPRKEGSLKASGPAVMGLMAGPLAPTSSYCKDTVEPGAGDHSLPKWLSPLWELPHSGLPWQRADSNSESTAPYPATATHTAAPQRKKPREDYGKLASAKADSGRADAILFMGSYRKS